MPFRSPTPFDQRHLAKGGTRGPMTAFVLRTFREQFFRELGDGKQERSAGPRRQRSKSKDRSSAEFQH